MFSKWNSQAMCSFGETAWNITHYYYDTKSGFMHDKGELGHSDVAVWFSKG